jgi:hypothetical protein
MKLLKFNLIFIPVLALCLGAVGYIAQRMLLEDARQHVIQNARIIMEAALSSRTYTTKQVAPVLEQKNFKLQSAVAEFRKTLESVPKAFECNRRCSVEPQEGIYSWSTKGHRGARAICDLGKRQAQ